MHPFAEVTNRTPSPSQKEESFYRKHSPWTAARHKKKTRSVQQHQQQAGDALPVFEQVIPEAYDSPDAQVKTDGGSAEYSLADCLSPAPRATPSPHSSPPVSKGSEEDAEVHPSKAYITEPQALASPQSMALGSVRRGDLAAAAAAAGTAGASCRSPVWFRSSDDVHAADASTQGHLHASSSAPACGNLFERFDQVAHKHPQQLLQHQHSQPCTRMPAPVLLQQQQQEHPGAAAVRGRRLTAKRGNGEQQLRTSAAAGSSSSCMTAAAASSSMGVDRGVDASSSSDWQQQDQQQPLSLLHSQHQQSAATRLYSAAGGLHSGDGCFQLHSRLSHIDDRLERRRSFGSGLLQQRWQCAGETRGSEDEWCADAWGVSSHAGAAAAATAGGAAAEEEVGTLTWFEARIDEAAEEGDVTAAQQLWSSLQAAGLKPSHRFMNAFLICCHYGGADPVEAEEAVRDMCVAADLEPDALTAKLLMLIDISWQQLQGGL